MKNLLERRKFMMSIVEYNWLDDNAVLLLTTAFGETDGVAVITAANAYLNDLARSSKTKAAALASFINEDPMMVCSLGLQVPGVTMPMRGLVTDGSAWIRTDIKPSRDLITHLDIKVAPPSSALVHRNIFGIYNYSGGWRRDTYFLKFNTLDSSSHRICCALSASDNISQIGQEIDMPLGTYIKIDITPARYIVNGTSSYTYSIPQEFDMSHPLTLFGTTYFINGNSYGCGCVVGLSSCEMEKNGQNFAKLIPFDGRTLGYGMIDIVNDKLYGASGSGSFTIEYTLQDGVTPWTPGT